MLPVTLLYDSPGLTLHSKGASEEIDGGWVFHTSRAGVLFGRVVCPLGFRVYSISCCGASDLSLNSGLRMPNSKPFLAKSDLGGVLDSFLPSCSLSAAPLNTGSASLRQFSIVGYLKCDNIVS